MRFMLHRNRTIASTCGISIEFTKGEFHLVPPAMYAEVIAAGGVPESELADDEQPLKPATPEAAAEREKALFTAFTTIAKRNARNDFTAGGMPHLSVLSKLITFEIEAKERDAAWTKFQSAANE
jgi:hypothetical protein